MSDLTLVKTAAPDLCVTDRADPRSLINLVPQAVKDAIDRVPREFLEMDEVELKTYTKIQDWTLIDRRLRTAFWIEYARAQDTKTQMQMAQVYNGICTRTHFYTTILNQKARLAYVLTPPADYTVSMEEALTFGVDRIREILELPIKDAMGRPDARVAKVILEAFNLIDQRQRGAVIQKHQIHQHNTSSKAAQETKKDAPASMDEIEQELQSLKAKVEPTFKRELEKITGESGPEDAELVP